MSEYYIASDKGPLGPYTTQQLIERRLKADSMVWRNGLTEWVRADSLSELDEVLNAPPTLPPAFNREQFLQRTQPEAPAPQYVYPDDEECPPTYRGLAILAFLGIIPCAVVSLVFSVRVKKLWEDGNREGAERSSRVARKLGMIGLLVGLPINILYFYILFTDPTLLLN